ncbi:MAG TPA: cytochrome-c oxidase, cbb3-type subunit I [Ignavibacteria bacterium]|nr:cytochrome-c oxidase, cbb3-type subunit I [Ignavibacteria bacterium]HRF67361.1 cytochrome-c oxidase, cbb3-type subunit I [Ignavibacteria bacterium]HRJ03059.1 cytochrome-c oxidase, cbb3-type subunit I [Ignavibacteria bacterium]HRJ84722.1 cytochrome-c oxidase, cbb3-type subunit I [Ignavibacteria bacterium]
MEMEKFSYDNRIVRNFAIATMVWGVVGMLVGLLIAFQIYLPVLNFGLPYTTFSRLRPLHTNAVIFAFVGNAMFMGIYYSLQRITKARMFSDLLSKIHFWGWQSIILSAALTLPLGITTSKEYAELEWPIDILIALVWVVFAINMFGTIAKRREKHMYVAIWFYVATVVTVAVLHIVNSIEIPVNLFKSYSMYAGVQDALVQWWYGHNAVAFFLTTPFLGLMYYYLPKAAGRPVYSYKLSIIHFWSLIFIYIWAGPHHLLYTALPDWAQSLGTVFSIMLIAPSWGGMINGLLTLRGAWDKVREDPILKFMVVAVTAYGMATFEGPMLSLKNVNAIAHYTDWIVAHVHVGALGWNGFLTFGILYWLIPRIYKTNLYSKKLANIHFWIGTLGIVFYAVPMYWSGITQSLMWKQFTPEGILQYPNFLETVTNLIPLYAIRSVGGTMYFVGVIIGVYNLVKTIKAGSLLAEEPAEAPARMLNTAEPGETKHRWLERKPLQFALVATVLVLIGGLIEIIPTFLVKSNVPTISSVKPYTPLELQGRDLYIREGCNNCHSQMIRPFRSETERYGEYSKAGEYVYDHPFLWGSKRTGPDLHREGMKYPNIWHYLHMQDPQQISPGSLMPAYAWLLEDELDMSTTEDKINALRSIGVPYPAGYEKIANEELMKQALEIAADLQKNGAPVTPEKEIVALIAYLQRLGTDIKGNKTADMKEVK